MKPTAQIVTPIIGQEIINSIHITSGLFNILITNGINNIYNIYIREIFLRKFHQPVFIILEL